MRKKLGFQKPNFHSVRLRKYRVTLTITKTCMAFYGRVNILPQSFPTYNKRTNIREVQFNQRRHTYK